MNAVEGLRKQNPSSWETAVLDTPVKYDGGIYVGTSGNVELVGSDGTAIVFVGASGFLPLNVFQINSAGTDASDIVGLKKN